MHVISLQMYFSKVLQNIFWNSSVKIEKMLQDNNFEFNWPQLRAFQVFWYTQWISTLILLSWFQVRRRSALSKPTPAAATACALLCTERSAGTGLLLATANRGMHLMGTSKGASSAPEPWRTGRQHPPPRSAAPLPLPCAHGSSKDGWSWKSRSGVQQPARPRCADVGPSEPPHAPTPQRQQHRSPQAQLARYTAAPRLPGRAALGCPALLPSSRSTWILPTASGTWPVIFKED